MKTLSHILTATAALIVVIGAVVLFGIPGMEPFDGLAFIGRDPS
jgi:hypothetical protein